MLIKEYLNECQSKVDDCLKAFKAEYGSDMTNAYAAFRWGFARKGAVSPEADYLDILTHMPAGFTEAKADIDKTIDDFVDTYGEGYTQEAVKETWNMVPGNPHMHSEGQSFDGSDKGVEHSSGVLYHLENMGTDWGAAMRESVLENASDEAKSFFNNLDYDPVRLQDCSLLSDKMWHGIRHYSIGASDIACLTGSSPFGNAQGTWYKKLSYPESKQTDDGKKELIFQWGHDMESYLRQMVLTHPEFGGCRVLIEPMLFGSEKAPFMTCNLDAILAWPDGHYSILEFKAPSPYKKSEYENNMVPAHYYDQIQGQMMLLNMDDAYLVALFDRDTITVSHVYRDLDYQMDLVKVCKSFWDDVESETLPELNGSGDVIIDIMNRYYNYTPVKLPPMESDDDECVQLLDEASFYSEQQKALTQEVDELKKRYTDITARIISAMGNNTQAIFMDKATGCIYKCKYTEPTASPSLNKADILRMKNEDESLYRRVEPYITYRKGGRRFTLRKIEKE